MKNLRDVVRRELSLAAWRRFRPLAGWGSLLALLGGLAASPALALSYRQETLDETATLKVSHIGSPDLADLDGDGDLDLTTGEHMGHLVYFMNSGTTSSPAYVEMTGSANPFGGINVEYRSTPELADLDGDGDLDLVLGHSEAGLRFFSNMGNSASPKLVELTGSANPFAALDAGIYTSPELVDLDADGDLDAAVGEAFDEIHYFANTGTRNFPAFVERTGSANPFADLGLSFVSCQPALADLDGDGDLDLSTGNGAGLLLYFMNTGNASAPAFVSDGTSSPFDGVDLGQISHPAFGDIDGDGDLDGVFGEISGLFLYFGNTGTSEIPAFAAIQGAGNPFDGFDVETFHSLPYLFDLDGDGDQDAVVGEEYGTLRYLENTGNSAAPHFVELGHDDNPFVEIDAGYFGGPALADLDGDADPDLVLGEHFGTLRYYENTGSSSAPAYLELSGGANPFQGVDVGYRSHPELADLDGDGDLDAVIGRYDGGLRYYQNSGSSSAPAFFPVTGSANPFVVVATGRTDPQLADFDGDSDLDLVIGHWELVYFENTGSSGAPAFVERTDSAGPFASVFAFARSSPAFRDLDGDGDLDGLVGDFSGRLVFLRADSSSLFADGFESGDTSAWSASLPDPGN
jgi:hypothetical protein